jgi:hypothetical protein
MKTKKLSFKMGLNKKTIANLNSLDLKTIIGGMSYNSCETEYTCPCCPPCTRDRTTCDTNCTTC